MCWETEIGKGRPAWNIQDAAIVTKHFSFTIDVACGGIDNLVRHHDYTIAVAEGVSGRKFARYWLHGAHLFVDGKKMSKSKGNVYYPEDLLAKGFRKDHARFFLIYGDYRARLNFTWEKLAETSRKLDEFKSMVQEVEKADSARPSENTQKLITRIVSDFEAHTDEDLDVKAAFDTLYAAVAALHDLTKKGKLSPEASQAALKGLRRVDRVLQVIF